VQVQCQQVQFVLDHQDIVYRQIDYISNQAYPITV